MKQLLKCLAVAEYEVEETANASQNERLELSNAVMQMSCVSTSSG